MDVLTLYVEVLTIIAVIVSPILMISSGVLFTLNIGGIHKVSRGQISTIFGIGVTLQIASTFGILFTLMVMDRMIQ